MAVAERLMAMKKVGIAQAVDAESSRLNPHLFPQRNFLGHIAQIVEQETENFRVAGAIPAVSANFPTRSQEAGYRGCWCFF